MDKLRRVLIVDDDEAFAESNKDLLEAYGYEVFMAFDGTVGVDIARNVKPDLMILDVMMTTNTEGFDVARAVREIPELAQMAILMVTGVVDALKLPQHLKPDSNWLPVNRVLEKPIDPARLVREVEQIFEEEEADRKSVNWWKRE
ncbi:MAG: response regulator [Lentisphaerae bacterium]|nr:response regulator [Lentisphaerota bacterium]